MLKGLYERMTYYQFGRFLLNPNTGSLFTVIEEGYRAVSFIAIYVWLHTDKACRETYQRLTFYVVCVKYGMVILHRLNGTNM